MLACTRCTSVARSSSPEVRHLHSRRLLPHADLNTLPGIFRTIEFGSGGNNTGYLLTREAWCTSLPPAVLDLLLTPAERADYGLETLPILLCCYFFLFSHPSRYIPSDRSVRLHPAASVAASSIGDAEKGSGTVTPELAPKRKWYRRS